MFDYIFLGVLVLLPLLLSVKAIQAYRANKTHMAPTTQLGLLLHLAFRKTIK